MALIMLFIGMELAHFNVEGLCSYLQGERHALPSGTPKQKNILDDNESSSDASSVEDLPQTLSYRTPLLTQASLTPLIPPSSSQHLMHLHAL